MKAPLLLACVLPVLAVWPLRADIITAVNGDYPLVSASGDGSTSPTDFIFGLDAAGGQLWLTTVTASYVSPLFSDPGSIGFQLIALLPPEMKLNDASVSLFTYGNPVNDNPTIWTTGVRGLLSSYDLTDQKVQSLFEPGLTPPVGFALLNGMEYALESDAPAIMVSNLTSGATSQLIDLSSTITGEDAMTSGSDGLLYTAGIAVGSTGSCSAGEMCVIRIDPATGTVVSGFPVVSGAEPGDILVGPDGSIYLADGDGQGAVYNASGTLLDTLVSTTSDPPASGTRTLLTLDDQGSLYMLDESTGLHVFEVGADSPEPGGPLCLGLGLLVLSGLVRRARRTGSLPLA